VQHLGLPRFHARSESGRQNDHCYGDLHQFHYRRLGRRISAQTGMVSNKADAFACFDYMVGWCERKWKL
jgi:hypothetical protein